jgi:hypothetical protein
MFSVNYFAMKTETADFFETFAAKPVTTRCHTKTMKTQVSIFSRPSHTYHIKKKLPNFAPVMTLPRETSELRCCDDVAT